MNHQISTGGEVASSRTRPADMGTMMHVKAMEVGDEHADLWEGLTITNRHVDGPSDVTVGEHAEFGLAVVSHFGLENRIEWFTEHVIAARRDTAH